MADCEHTSRKCRQCGSEKPLSEFYLRKNGRRAQCKSCVTAKHREYIAKNQGGVSEYKKRWQEANAVRVQVAKRARYRENAEDIKRKAAEYAKAHPERVRGYKRAWKQSNPQALREYRFVRGNAQRQATPAWADRAAMLAIYLEARELTRTTGVEHHVDHIVPVLSPLVCGLHCQQNMQILSASDNISKLNRWWPDMWA